MSIEWIEGEKFSCNYSNHWVSLGGAQNYGVGDYGLDKIDNEGALEGESESLFFETAATRPGSKLTLYHTFLHL